MGMEGIGLLFEEHVAPSSTARITLDVNSSRAQGVLLHACGALRVGGAQDVYRPRVGASGLASLEAFEVARRLPGGMRCVRSVVG
ncbi:hypothetical protein FHW12_004237 [Dokdonella fugitiva]|uniref:Uncharacterized protein n=1 Tax=Dokdonella fugitiva TaxID=328517 RepID=A0A839FA71_9GAMM|nr:hypothetical protein [Dokdonella fugitiva]MBA8889990.1 hypothetical protein [Dokdonella fugitiva]